MTNPHPLAQARHRDTETRQHRVHQALAEMSADGSEITVSHVARRAGVHRSFIHRHPDLHSAVIQAQAAAGTAPSPRATKIGQTSLRTENANLHAHNRRLAERITTLEHRLSEALGHQAFHRAGLAASTADLRAQLTEQTQASIELTGRLERREAELADARETIRRLMNENNRA
ncbi:DUF6262 family protein [Amycolatopsis alkalitolerans]|uniref:Uncharacterized protein n=1 Tax=Amycolatopsis alkalitolerans TaxID=2547244 RepID=A0A5C4M2F3_9PSEU|nr:DUF6262 family protein [Amycolatopsis alkalitolerans]TNC26398.1 hypothetical protein FG385_11600 [Amycolatopsis alkalitolerans]